VRTPRCPLEKDEVFERVCSVLTLADIEATMDPDVENVEDLDCPPERVQEIDLRAMYYLARGKDT